MEYGDQKVWVRRTCEQCDGRGVLGRPRCALCGTPVTSTFALWEEEAARLPCGHDVACLDMQPVCPDCGGTGQRRVGLSGEDAVAWQRRMRRRMLFLFVLLLVPAVAVLAAVLSGESHQLCGSWWYGTAALLWLSRRVA